jgi:IMP dehydrogenase/GMP reductase
VNWFGKKSIPISYGFDSVAIVQKKNVLKSRLDANIKSEIIRGVYLDIPIIAANMSTVVDSDFCILLDRLGSLGVMHRADNEDVIIEEVNNISKRCSLVAASVGVTEDQFDFCSKLIHNGANIIFIDIAHGYSDYVLEFGRKIKKEFGVKVVVGNTTNVEMIKEASDFADAIKIGIAQGFSCETKNTAGCTERQFSAVLKFKTLSKKYGIPIISDGGIREPADFTKSIAAGANSIMAGKIFAECPESAAEVVVVNDVSKKLYAGMASEYVQKLWRGGVKEGTCTEGGVRYLDIGMGVKQLLERYSGALKSGISYSGAFDIRSFQKNVDFVRLV